MTIISHRGYWKTPDEKNQPVAFERSFALGFGTETDVRDYHGQIVIAHDPVSAPCLTLEEMLGIYSRIDPTLPLAINIKADGLQPEIVRLFQQFKVTNYFLFDMSVPDAVCSLKAGLTVYTRHSDMEPVPPFYEQASGVWMDGFHHTWFTPAHLQHHISSGKRVCVVSPELHRRPHTELWTEIRQEQGTLGEVLMLCTDYPEEARAFFHEKN